MSGCTHSTPKRSSGRVRRKGDPGTRGWIAAQMSWRKPGSVRSAVRFPPPIVALASITRTERPARAKVMAAASPLGPEPTTTASNIGIVQSVRQCSKGGLESCNTYSKETRDFGRSGGALSIQLRWMPSCQYPVPSGGKNIFVVHVKSLYCCISNGVESQNT